MVLFRVRIHVDEAQRARVLHSLLQTVWATQSSPGCLGAHLSMEVGEERGLVLMEEWQSEEYLRARLRGDAIKVVLAAIDCAVAPPEVRFDTVSDTKGLEFIATCRAVQTRA